MPRLEILEADITTLVVAGTKLERIAIAVHDERARVTFKHPLTAS